MRQFSDEARQWLANYHGSIDATALLIAYDDGKAQGDRDGYRRGIGNA